MSLFDDASLAMIPSAYKDGKLYSIKPTDGSGDFTFTRGSNLAATRVDENGLIEKGRENLVLQSNQFDTTWGNITTTEFGGQSGYDGTNDAWRINLNAGTTLKAVNQSFSAYSGVSTASFYAKAGAHSIVQFGTATQSTVFVAFDLSNGSVGPLSSLAINASMISVGGGWYRIQVAFKAEVAAGFVIAAVDSLSATRFPSTSSTGDFYIQDAQLELGLVATDYIETTTTTAQAGILEDMPRLDYSGGASCPSLLLEPNRTNLVVDSEYFDGGQYSYIFRITRTPNAAISPEGLQNAYAITETIDNGTHLIGQASWGQSVADTSVSVFAKANGRRYIVLGNANMSPSMNTWFDLENGVIGIENPNLISSNVEDFGNGWYRCSISYLPNKANTYPTIYLSDTDGATSYQGDGVSGVYLYGYQIEVGASYPTSYIPTYGTSQTRSLDLTTADTSSFYTDSSKGTLFTEISFPLAADGNYNGWFFWNGSTYYRIVLQRRGDTGKGQVEVRINNTTQASIISPSAITLEDNHKMLVRWDGSVFTLFLDGANIGSDTSTDIFSGTNLNELASRPTYNAANIKQAVLFPTALTDSECIALTTL